MKIRTKGTPKQSFSVSIRDGDFNVIPTACTDRAPQPFAYYIVAVGPQPRCQLSMDYPTEEKLMEDWTKNGVEVPSDPVSLAGRIVLALLESGAVEVV
jgi:hypothetical protein